MGYWLDNSIIKCFLILIIIMQSYKRKLFNLGNMMLMYLRAKEYSLGYNNMEEAYLPLNAAETLGEDMQSSYFEKEIQQVDWGRQADSENH